MGEHSLFKIVEGQMSWCQLNGHMTFYISAMLPNCLRSTVNAKSEKKFIEEFSRKYEILFHKIKFQSVGVWGPQSLTFFKFKIKPEKQTPKRHFCQKNFKMICKLPITTEGWVGLWHVVKKQVAKKEIFPSSFLSSPADWPREHSKQITKFWLKLKE